MAGRRRRYEGLSVTYKGMGISYNENSDMWYVSEDGKEYSTLTQAKKRIDGLVKANFQRYTILSVSRGKITEWEVTSIDVDGSLWIIKKGEQRKAQRTKISREYQFERYYTDTPENRDLMSRIEAEEIKKEYIDAEIKKLEKQLVRVRIGNKNTEDEE